MRLPPRMPASRRLAGCALLAAALCACGGAVPAASAQAAAPAAAAGRGRLFSEDTVRRVQEQAVQALAEGAGIELRQPVPALLLTAAEARERRAAFSRDLPEHGGITAAVDLAADFVFSESMLGRYLPDEKVLYIIEEVLEQSSEGDVERAHELLFGVMAHELVHAHDDQVYGAMPDLARLMGELAADGRKLAEMQTHMSLVEGHATYAAELASLHAGHEPLSVPTVERARRARVMDGGEGRLSQLGAGLVNTIARTKLIQYAQGRDFCRAAHRFGGERFLGEVFRHLPLSLEELADFERFKQRWAREMEAAEDTQEAAAGEPPAPPGS